MKKLPQCRHYEEFRELRKGTMIGIKIVVFLLLLISLTAEGWAELYYVKPGGTRVSGASTPNDWSNANCYPLPSSAVAQGNDVVGPHTMFIAPGDYFCSLLLTNNNWSNGTIIGTAGLDSTTAAAKGNVTLTSTQSVIQTSVINLTIKNISATGTTAKTGAFYSSGGSTTLDNCYFYDSLRLIYVPKGTVTSRRGLYAGNTDSTRPSVAIEGAANFTSNFDIIAPKGNNSLGLFGLYITSTGSVSINNSALFGAENVVIYQDAAATTTITNSIVLGSWKENAYTIYAAAGTIKTKNNLLMHNWGAQDRLTPVILDPTDITRVQPGWERRPRKGIVVLSVDDLPVDSYRLNLEALLTQKGVKGSYFENTEPLPDDDLPALQGIWNRGVMDIGLHGRTHSNWTYTGKFWDVTKNGATMTINRNADTITFSTGETVTGFREKTLANIKRELEGCGATVTPGPIYGDTGTQLHTFLTGESIADGVAVTAVSLKTDDLTGNTGYYKDEIKDHYDWFVNIFGTPPSVAATPGGGSNQNVQTVVKNIGLNSLRSYYNNSDAQSDLKSIDLYRTSYYPVNSLITANATADEATTKARTRAVADRVVQSGSLQYWLVHNSSEATLEQLGWIIDVLKEEYPEIMVTDGRTATTYIKTSGLWSTSDGRTYTRTWDDPGDFHLDPTSAAINSGTNLPWEGTPNVTDFEGKSITDANGNVLRRSIGGVAVNNVDIGPYQYPSDGMLSILSITKSGSGNGTVTISTPNMVCNTSCTANYTFVTPVTLHAQAGQDAIFDGWSGACSGKSDCNLTMNSDRSVTAMFSQYVRYDGTVELIGDLKMNSPSGSKPDCTGDSQRGIIWFTKIPETPGDTLEMCGKDAAGNFSWKPIVQW